MLAGVNALSSNDIRVGTNVEVGGAPWKVLGHRHLTSQQKFVETAYQVHVPLVFVGMKKDATSVCPKNV